MREEDRWVHSRGEAVGDVTGFQVGPEGEVVVLVAAYFERPGVVDDVVEGRLEHHEIWLDGVEVAINGQVLLQGAVASAGIGEHLDAETLTEDGVVHVARAGPAECVGHGIAHEEQPTWTLADCGGLALPPERVLLHGREHTRKEPHLVASKVVDASGDLAKEEGQEHTGEGETSGRTRLSCRKNQDGQGESGMKKEIGG